MASCGGSASLDLLGTDARRSQAGSGTLSALAMDAYPAAGFLLHDTQGPNGSRRSIKRASVFLAKAVFRFLAQGMQAKEHHPTKKECRVDKQLEVYRLSSIRVRQAHEN